MKPRAVQTIGSDRYFEISAGLIKKVHYAPSTQRLMVWFRDGKTYVYLDVPAGVFDQLHAAESVASAFGEYVRKPNYAYEKVA
jgi:hypothetical protein